MVVHEAARPVGAEATGDEEVLGDVEVDARDVALEDVAADVPEDVLRARGGIRARGGGRDVVRDEVGPVDAVVLEDRPDRADELRRPERLVHLREVLAHDTGVAGRPLGDDPVGRRLEDARFEDRLPQVEVVDVESGGKPQPLGRDVVERPVGDHAARPQEVLVVLDRADGVLEPEDRTVAAVLVLDGDRRREQQRSGGRPEDVVVVLLALILRVVVRQLHRGGELVGDRVVEVEATVVALEAGIPEDALVVVVVDRRVEPRLDVAAADGELDVADWVRVENKILPIAVLR